MDYITNNNICASYLYEEFAINGQSKTIFGFQPTDLFLKTMTLDQTSIDTGSTQF